MCGIVGIVDYDGAGNEAGLGLQRALDRMRQRGPDAADIWSDPFCAFGHRRLAVIDLTEGGRQPMSRHGLVITYNGEIYNYEVLRKELECLGHCFATRSDTEVVLAGWRQWGEALLPKLSGMFAMAIWNPINHELVLATDRFGKKPLVYSHDGRRIGFASDLIALRHAFPFTGDIDQGALKLFFALRYIPAPWTIFGAARKLPGGHIAKFTREGLVVRRWDTGPRAYRPVFSDREEAVAEIRNAFDRAVLDRLVSDVPVGAFLSGGIDSAIVCAALAAHNRKVLSFTVGFGTGEEYYEERPAARKVAAHLGLDHMEIEIGAEDALSAVDEVFAACDEPFADSSALPVFLLSRETRRHVTVALSGDGADEIFGGYRKFQGEIYAQAWQSIPGPLRRLFVAGLNAIPEGKQNRWLEMSRRMRRFSAHAGKSEEARQAGWMSQLDESELRDLIPGCREMPSVLQLVGQHYAEADGDPINRMLVVEQRIGLQGDMLRKVDLMSMANSLEVRCPFLDRQFSDLAAAIPGKWKLEPGRGKAILRDAFKDRLPPDVFALPKKGFEMPIAAWLRSSLSNRLRAATDESALRRRGLINPEPVRRWVTELETGRRDTSWQLWALMCLQAWLERSES